MGQGTHGLLFGVRAPEGLELEDGWGHGPPWLLDLWRQRSDVDAGDEWHRRGIVEHRADYTGDGARLLGVWIAVGASGIDGVPDLDTTVSLREVESTEPYAARLAWAREEWARFVGWAETQGVTLDAPDLWLTTTEVA